jgi:hypothetical protein
LLVVVAEHSSVLLLLSALVELLSGHVVGRLFNRRKGRDGREGRGEKVRGKFGREVKAVGNACWAILTAH